MSCVQTQKERQGLVADFQILKVLVKDVTTSNLMKEVKLYTNVLTWYPCDTEIIAIVFIWHWSNIQVSHVTDMWYSCDRHAIVMWQTTFPVLWSSLRHYLTNQLYTHTSVFSLPMGRTCTDASCGFVVIVWVILSDSRQSRTVFLSLLTHTLLPSASAIARVRGRHVVTEEESGNSWRVLSTYVCSVHIMVNG